MRKLINWCKKNEVSIIRSIYVIPILLAVFVSINHVIAFYELTNPSGWAIYLSVGVEIAALSALAGMVKYVNKKTYFPFIVVTLIQLIGNVFSSYLTIDVNSNLYKTWVELVNFFYTFEDQSANKAFLALIAGVPIPILSLSFLDILVSFNTKQKEKNETKNIENTKEDSIINSQEDLITPSKLEQEVENGDEIINNEKEKEEGDKIVEEKKSEVRSNTGVGSDEYKRINSQQADIIKAALEKINSNNGGTLVHSNRNQQKRNIAPRNGRN